MRGGERRKGEKRPAQEQNVFDPIGRYGEKRDCTIGRQEIGGEKRRGGLRQRQIIVLAKRKEMLDCQAEKKGDRKKKKGEPSPLVYGTAGKGKGGGKILGSYRNENAEGEKKK